MGWGEDMGSKSIIIIGTGSFAKLMCFYLKQFSENKIVGFSVEKEFLSEPTFDHLPVYPLEDLAHQCPPASYDLLMAIGTSNMNLLRKRLFLQCKAMGYHFISFIHPSCTISDDVKMGEGNILLEKSLIQPFVEIGDGNLFWDNIAITHNDKIGSFNTIAGGVGLSGFVTVQNNCYLGKHSMVFDKVTISDFTLVGAGAHVKKDTNPYDVIVPARSITLEGKKSTDFKL